MPEIELDEFGEMLVRKIQREERKRVWMLINLDMMIPMQHKARIRDLLFGTESDEPIFQNREF